MIDGKLSLVLPAHNEEQNIQPVINEARQTLPRFVHEYEILVVNDGSQDGTGTIAREIAANDPNVQVIDHPENRGYGAALRTGFENSTGDWVMIMDSDRQFDIGDLVYLAPLTSEYELVAGYRIHRNDPFHRTLFGKVFRLAMRVLFGVQLYDIDCAFKLIRGDRLRSLNLESTGAMVSTELMARWARTGASWTQVGVHHYPRTAGEQSGGSLKVILKAMRDVPILWWRLNRETKENSGAQPGDTKESTGLTLGQAGLIVSGLILAIAAFVTKLIRRHD